MAGDLQPGTYVGRYKIQRRIGAGAMGDVYLAEDEGLTRKVALKLLSEVHKDNPELKARFLREARAVAKISHPNVVQVFSIEEYQGRPSFAMEYLPGKDLGVIVKEQGPLLQARAVAAARDAAHGLAEASRLGLIHRDVKPTNLIVTDKGLVKVTDFGLAKPLDSADPGLTQAGVVVGTPDYIAPEQARGDELDERVDIYALGCTLFYLLTGKPPFRQDEDHEDRYLKVVARHIRSPVPDVRDATDQPVDDDVAELCMKMMSKKPADRPSYAELTHELDSIARRLAGGSGIAVARARTAKSPKPVPGKTAPTRIERPPSSRVDGGASPFAPDESAQYQAPRRFPWAVVITSASALFFVVSLALYLTAPKRGSAGGVSARSDGGLSLALADAGPATKPPLVVPDGFLIARDFDGKPRFFVSRLPVSKQDFSKIMTPRKKPPESKLPVTDVAFTEARSFAGKLGKRLLTPDEWDLAINTDGFTPAGMLLWEWVDDGGKQTPSKQRPVRKAPMGAKVRDPKGWKDVTFRLAQDLPK